MAATCAEAILAGDRQLMWSRFDGCLFHEIGLDMGHIRRPGINTIIDRTDAMTIAERNLLPNPIRIPLEDVSSAPSL